MVGWLEIRAQVNERLVAEGVPPLTEQDAFLLYLMILLLYEEGVEPSKAEILFKLREHNASDPLVQHAVAYYAATPQWYQVVQATDQIHCVYFRQQPKWFRGWVDLKSPTNHYPPELWVDFLDFLLHSLDGQHSDPGGGPGRGEGWLFSHTRYVLAKALKKHGPLSLQRLRLGDIAHLIQLALQQEYLCYETTMIVPSWISPSFIADKNYILSDDADAAGFLASVPADVSNRFTGVRCADGTSPPGDDHRVMAGPSPSGVDFGSCSTTAASTAEWLSGGAEDLGYLRECLKKLLADHDRILLSQVRVMLLSKYHITLKPSKYGYSKLSSLLVDRFADICRLVRHRNRHVYLEAGTSLLADAAPRACPSLYFTAQRAANLRALLASHKPFSDTLDMYCLDLTHDSTSKSQGLEWTPRDLYLIDELVRGSRDRFFGGG